MADHGLTRDQIVQLIAHHEAGHAVVAAHAGLAVTSLDVRQYDGVDGWWADGITYVTYFPHLADGFALQGASGELAARRWLDNQGLLTDDTTTAANGDHDRDQAIELLAEDGIQVSWPGIRSRAHDLVTTLWPQIQAVATTAADRGRLSGSEISALLAVHTRHPAVCR